MDFVLRLEGETWLLERAGHSARLRDTHGLRILDRLLSAPGRELHVLELTSSAAESGRAAAGDAGEVLDARAIDAYRKRAQLLRDELAEAEAQHDLGAPERRRAEFDALSEQLVQGVGLGGRARRAGGAAEKARVNVQRRLRDAIERIRVLDPELADHLSP
jgi:hypothetical protein